MNLLPEISITPNTIHHMDLFKLCNAMPDASVDMILCDLPYGTTACSWDTIIPIEPMWEAFMRVIKPRGAIVLTASQPFTSVLISSNLTGFNYTWTWIKNSVSSPAIAHYQPLRVVEDVIVFNSGIYYPQGLKPFNKVVNKGNKAGGEVWAGGTLNQGKPYLQLFTNYPKNIIRFERPSKNNHPSQKPVALFEYLIKTYTQPGELVFDPCVGSGTTAVAARNTGRKYICGDFTREYVELARERVQASDPYQPTTHKNGVKQLSLFENLTKM